MEEITITKEEYAAFKGIETDAVTDNVMALVFEALEVIKLLVAKNVNPKNESMITAIKKAAMAQADYWLINNSNVANNKEMSSYKLGELSVNYNVSSSDVGDASKIQLAPLARLYLNSQYLLYTGHVKAFKKWGCDNVP